MWASLDTWLLGDGQIPELGLGDVIHDVGLRLHCSYLRGADGSSETTIESPMDPEGRVRYRLVGRCHAVSSPMAALIGMAGWLTTAEPATFRVVPHALDSPGYEPWSPDFQVPVPDQMVEVEGWLGIVADYEWDAFAIPDARMGWRIQGIRLLELRRIRVPEQSTPTFTSGPVVKVTSPDRLSRAADAKRHARYLVELAPVNPA